MRTLKFESYLGLGDQVYMRPFVMEALKHYDRVDVVTPFPDFLYAGTTVNCIKPQTELKTQKEYADKTVYKWSMPLAKYDRIIRPNYAAGFPRGENVTNTFIEQTGLVPTDYSLTIPQEYINKATKLVKTEKPICFLRLPTIRKEWVASSRNSKMCYFQLVINMLKDTHYIVSCLDLRNGEEWLDGELPSGIDLCLHNAELDVNGMLGLMAISDCMIGIQSNLIPLSCALQKPCFIIYGGYVPNEVLVDKKMGLDKYRHIQPENFCFCVNGRHNCNKEIDTDRLRREFNLFKKEVLCLKK